jgi:hypothetical protein
MKAKCDFCGYKTDLKERTIDQGGGIQPARSA